MPRKKAEQKPRYPIYKMGKWSGYEEYEDGSIKIAQSSADLFDSIRIETAALQSIVDVVLAQAQKIMSPLTKRKEAFWRHLAEDYGLDYQKFDYTYDFESHIVHGKEKTEKAKGATS